MPWILLAVLLALSTYWGRALRWKVFLKPICPNASLWRLFQATAVGFTAIVLFGRPGEMVRPYLIARKEGVSFTSQVAAWLLERIYDLLFALIVFGLALSQVERSGAQVGEKLRWVLETGGQLVGLIAVVCLAMLIFLSVSHRVAERRLLDALAFLPERYRERVGNLVNAFTSGAASTRDAGAVGWIALYSALEWLLIVACYWCIFKAIPVTAHLNWTDAMIFLGFVAFGGVVQIPGVGGGVQVVAVLVLTELFRMPFEVAGGVAIIFWIITFVVIVPFGLTMAFLDGLSWSRLRQIEREAVP